MVTTYLSTREIYEHLFRVASSERFLQKQGLGNEIPFFICPYNPADQLEMDQRRKQLINQLKHKGVSILDINLCSKSA